MSKWTMSPFFAFMASSVSSKNPTCPGGTAFLLSAMSRMAIVDLLPFLTTSLSIGCKSSSWASFSFRITIWMSPVAMSMSLTRSFIEFIFVFCRYDGPICLLLRGRAALVLFRRFAVGFGIGLVRMVRLLGR